jgi:hypothetical protein
MASDQLTETDHQNMDSFRRAVLDDYRDGTPTKEQAMGGLAHVMAALNIGNVGEARAWVKEGVKLIRDGA